MKYIPLPGKIHTKPDLLHNNQVQRCQVLGYYTASDGLSTSFTVSTVVSKEALLTRWHEDANSVGSQNTLLHRKTLLVLSTHDFKDVTLLFHRKGRVFMQVMCQILCSSPHEIPKERGEKEKEETTRRSVLVSNSLSLFSPLYINYSCIEKPSVKEFLRDPSSPIQEKSTLDHDKLPWTHLRGSRLPLLLRFSCRRKDEASGRHQSRPSSGNPSPG